MNLFKRYSIKQNHVPDNLFDPIRKFVKPQFMEQILHFHLWSITALTCSLKAICGLQNY